jgi:hypothetical protein
MKASTCRPTSIRPSRPGPTDATSADLDLDPDRGLPGRPGHLDALQADADPNRRQPLDDGAALNLNLNLNLDRSGPDNVTANHVGDANPETHVNAFGVSDEHTAPGPLTDGDAFRDGDANSLSHRFSATLAGPPVYRVVSR